MINKKLQIIELIADKHIEKINEALKDLNKTFPLTEQALLNMSKQQVLEMEMLTSRFAKLQDHLGANAFDLFFEIKGEDVSRMAIIDKLNLLEKIYIIDDPHIWIDMRATRNIIVNEYPDNPGLIASTLNLVPSFVTLLIDIKNKLFASMRSYFFRPMTITCCKYFIFSGLQSTSCTGCLGNCCCIS